MDVHKGGRARRPDGQERAGGSAEAITDAAHLQQQLSLGTSVEYDSPQRTNHRFTPVTEGLRWGEG
jgi:hypothetical protein